MLTPMSTAADWVRVQIGAVRVSEAEARDLRERDVLLVDPPLVRTDLGEGGPAVLALSSGRQFSVELALEDGWWVAHIKEAQHFRMIGELMSINVVHRPVDLRELPDLRPGAMVALNALPSDQLIISWHDEIFGNGLFVEIDGRLGVRVTRLAR